ncbi:MAG: PQQ-dependent sugar dehydrogenase, partial [Sphingobium sp.]
MKKYLLIAVATIVIALGGIYFYLMSGLDPAVPESELTGREPKFTTPRKEILPSVKIAKPIGWAAGAAPKAVGGLPVVRFAEGLDHPRSLYRLPNGDVLVAESRAPEKEARGITDWVQGKLMGAAGATGKSANRITLLRDGNGDGKAEGHFPFLTGLNSPYGMALVGDTLYVANTDSLMAFPYKDGDTQIVAAGRKVSNLPANAPNYHWTKSLAASPDGKLYVGIGSNSNIAENGLDPEDNRALVMEIIPKEGSANIFASGLRNPTDLAWNPWTGELWAVVNERDM